MDRTEEEYVIQLRRELHRHPEQSGAEQHTSAVVRRELDGMGIPYRIVGEYGVIATLGGARPGKTVLLRADMDALPVREDRCNLLREKGVISQIDGVSHACGHDAHVAMLLGAARKLASMRDRLAGRVLFCFEQGEENFSGIDAMMRGLENETVDCAWGIHVKAELEAGAFAVGTGPIMAGIYGFCVTITGKGGHGSRPYASIDPLLCAARMVEALNSVIQCEVDPQYPAVMTVCSFHAGTVDNVIPDTAQFSGTIRYYEKSTGTQVKDALVRVVEALARAGRCEAEITYQGSGIPTVNDAAVSAFASASITRRLGNGCLASMPPIAGSDSMAQYLNRYPGVYVFLGVRNQRLGTGAPQHNPKFDIDESCLKSGVIATVGFTEDYLNGITG
ncbi:M20 metallopeptidase family protein [Ethanoligenens harbinense]|uniref:Amidohydrolase n=1 Tax=Ethanoligenens harbinense (strain DSM 18485 / JCM 12961 / CGMCC 1.5033 / YUAN-3) TaxID=663278 RepID=E6U4E7_ETHHY|nr:M20 family metallopeptidase [Ethanoligenens harbinense]ADU27754.1 amidohydrolase [Ethanoligenens harbinense YUAN-3]AVQ96779.1 amidohydrolase [Ethanoligenens harbinense YUAN-3]AYF39441.1 amidohydrolase [Ethanoligenens harbinense]AYF42265.1 amidohydrolase [Ethanoligenens harbinense]QCN93021.1 amidohydrolase [Ethanoligenens harbinense]